MRNVTVTCLFSLHTVVVLAAHAEAQTIEQIMLWVRAPGTYGASNAPKRDHVYSLSLDKAPLVEKKLYDQQYKRSVRFRGVSLAFLVSRHQTPRFVDTALLHFSNKVIIAYPLHNKTVQNKLGAFLAIYRWSEQSRHWTRNFPSLRRRTRYFSDRKPIQFKGNKVVVITPWHPYVPKNASRHFSPWLFANSLVGVEYVDSKAYTQQFLVSAKRAVKRGLERAKETCLFCHGVRHVGANYGWDFTEAMSAKWRKSHPSYGQSASEHVNTHRSASPSGGSVLIQSYGSAANTVGRETIVEKSLYHQVTTANHDAAARGLRMPALPHLGLSDITDIWHWIRATAKHPLRPYRVAANRK